MVSTISLHLSHPLPFSLPQASILHRQRPGQQLSLASWVLSKCLCPLSLVVDQTFLEGLYRHSNPMNPTAHSAHPADVVLVRPAHSALGNYKIYKLYDTNGKRGQDFGLLSLGLVGFIIHVAPCLSWYSISNLLLVVWEKNM